MMSYPTQNISSAKEEKPCSMGICATTEVSQAYRLKYQKFSIQGLANGCTWPFQLYLSLYSPRMLSPLWSWLSWLMLSFPHAWLFLCPSPVFYTVSFLPPPHLLIGNFLLKCSILVLRSQFICPLQILLQLIWVHSSLLLDSIFLLLRAVVLEMWPPNPQHQHHHYLDLLEMEIRRPHHMPPELQTLGVELSSLHFY